MTMCKFEDNPHESSYNIRTIFTHDTKSFHFTQFYDIICYNIINWLVKHLFLKLI